MILHVYGMKNRLSGIFEKPFAELADPTEYSEQLFQSLALAPVDALQLHKEFDLYCLGTIDSKSGEIVPSVSFVCSLEQMCLSLISSKEVKKEVSDEQVASV